MIRSRLASWLLVVASGLPSLALAATLASTQPALIAQLSTLRSALPTTGLTKTEAKQKKALDVADTALSHDTDLAGNLVDARKAVTLLDKAYPDDPTLAPLLASLVSTLSSQLQTRLTALSAARDAMPDGAAKSKVSKKIDKAQSLLTAAGSAATRASALKTLAKTLGQVTAGEKKLGTPGGGPTTSEWDIQYGNPVTDQAHYPSTPAGPLDHYTVVSSGSGANGIFTLSAAAEGTNATYAVMFFVIGPAVGDRPMTLIGSGLSLIPGDTTPLTAGTVTFTTWDPGHQKCAGTYTATFGALTASGSFSSIDMVVQ